jgi:hypothetical protein
VKITSAVINGKIASKAVRLMDLSTTAPLIPAFDIIAMMAYGQCAQLDGKTQCRVCRQFPPHTVRQRPPITVLPNFVLEGDVYLGAHTEGLINGFL